MRQKVSVIACVRPEFAQKNQETPLRVLQMLN
jgi:hypothetical protein